MEPRTTGVLRLHILRMGPSNVVQGFVLFLTVGQMSYDVLDDLVRIINRFTPQDSHKIEIVSYDFDQSRINYEIGYSLWLV